MDIIELLQNFGFPALIGAGIFKYVQVKLKEVFKVILAIKAGMQATVTADCVLVISLLRVAT